MIEKIEYYNATGFGDVNTDFIIKEIQEKLSGLSDEFNNQNGTLIIKTKGEGSFEYECENITEDLNSRVFRLLMS